MQRSATFYLRSSLQGQYSLLAPVSVYREKLRWVISNLRIFGQSLIKGNCYNSRTSDDIDITLVLVTKLKTKNKTTSKKIDNDVMSENCNVIAIFQIFGQFEAALMWILEAQSVTLLFSLIVTFDLTRTENRTKKFE